MGKNRRNDPNRITKFLEHPPTRLSEASIKKRMLNTTHRTSRMWLTECIEEQKHRCAYCKKSFSTDAFTLDHIQALAAGGDHARHNVCAACEPCNKRKGSMDVDQFREILAAEVAERKEALRIAGIEKGAHIREMRQQNKEDS